MPRYTVTLELEADDLQEVMSLVARTPGDFSPLSDWTGFKSYTVDGPDGRLLRQDVKDFQPEP